MNNYLHNTYNTYKVSVAEAFLYFLVVLIAGQILAGIVSLPSFLNPELSGIFMPLGFLAGFGGSAVIIMMIKKLSFAEVKKFFLQRTKFIHILVAIGLYFASLPLAEYLSMLVPTEGYTFLEKLYEIFEDSFAIVFEYKIAAFIMVCILAPVLEELIFRGLILRGMLQKGVNPWFSIILTAFLFGLAHMNPWQFFGAGLLGAVFGYIYWRTQSLWLCIFLHFLNNFIAYIITIETNSLDETVFEPNFMLLAGSAVLTALIAWFLYQRSRDTELKEAPQPVHLE